MKEQPELLAVVVLAVAHDVQLTLAGSKPRVADVQAADLGDPGPTRNWVICSARPVW